MANRLVKLSAKRIMHLPEYRMADRAETDILVNLALEFNYLFEPRLHKIYKIHPLMWKYSWSPLQGMLPPRQMKYFKTHAMEIFHALLHSLVARRYGAHQFGGPLLCFFSEALASSLDLYFALKLEKCLGQERANKVSLLHLYSRSSHELKLPFVKDFLHLQKQPYESYRHLVKHLITMMRDLSEIDKLSQKKDPVGATLKMLKAHEESTLRVFAHHYDIPNFILYAKAYCGSKSSAQDKKNFNDGLKKLEAATSLSELVLSFG